MPDKQISNKTLFHYAPSEMTGSGFWAWVLDSLIRNSSSEQDVQALARNFLKAHLNSIKESDIHDVGVEHKIGKAGRIDIIIYGDRDADKAPQDRKVLAIIENKVFSTPLASKLLEQVNGYARACNKTSPKKIVMTWRYDTSRQWPMLGAGDVEMIDLEAQLALFAGIHIKNDILRQYYSYAKETHGLIKYAVSYASAKWGSIPSKIPFDGFLKYELMHQITAHLKADENSINIGHNPNGRQWIQWGFDLSGKRFFYRLDEDSEGLYLRLNYYTWADSQDGQHARKEQIMTELAQICLNIQDREPWKLTASKGEKNRIDFRKAYPKAKESTLWYLRFKDCQNLTADQVRDHLTRWHQEFCKSQ